VIGDILVDQFVTASQKPQNRPYGFRTSNTWQNAMVVFHANLPDREPARQQVIEHHVLAPLNIELQQVNMGVAPLRHQRGKIRARKLKGAGLILV
jgi:hypothetical protein